MSGASQPTQYKCQKMTVEGRDIKAIFVSLDYYESIYIPTCGGSVTIMDSSKAGFIEENNIEFIEKFEFEFQNADGESIQFKGVLNGLRNEQMAQQLKMYVIDFTSETVRKNEQKRVVQRFKDKNPKNIVSDMIKLVEGKEDKVTGSGEPMNFIGNRRRPLDIVKFVCTNGLSGKSSVSDPSESDGKPEETECKGTTGFLCWETQKGYRFASVKDILDGSAGQQTGEYKYRMMNVGEKLSEAMKSILDIQFQQIGDYQSHQRGGAYYNKVISFDMDVGKYTEFDQEEKSESSQKQAKETKEPSRIFARPFTNERFENEGKKAQKNKYDQSRKYLSQNAVSQNNAPDTLGQFTVPLSPKIMAGDTFKCKVYKVTSGSGGSGFDKKHSGKYIVKQVGHHFNADGQAYTRLNTVRSTKQQNDASS
jgi:hypothetical protein